MMQQNVWLQILTSLTNLHVPTALEHMRPNDFLERQSRHERCILTVHNQRLRYFERYNPSLGFHINENSCLINTCLSTSINLLETKLPRLALSA